MRVFWAAFWVVGLMLAGGNVCVANDRFFQSTEGRAGSSENAFQEKFDNESSSRFLTRGSAAELPAAGCLGWADAHLKGFLTGMPYQHRTAVYGFFAGFLLLGTAAVALYVLGLRLRSRREELVMRYQQEMLKLVRDLAVNPGLGPGEKARLGKSSTPGVFPEIIEPIIPALLHPEALPRETQDPAFQLIRLVFTGNLKERALAAARLLKLDPVRALNIINELMRTDDPFQRESMAIVLGEYYHPQTVVLLSSVLQDAEYRVAVAAYRALLRLSRLPATELPEDARQNIKLLLGQAPAGLRNS
ncbi:MAG: hypothetical protein HGA76_05055 [Candidatus Firestonebacteria bacterium]|nr:hypothetical protein [Candidatus Firestonebacteria bacterium]